MVAPGQPRRVYTGREEDLLDLIAVLSPAQRNVILEAISRKARSDEAQCSSDLSSFEITGLGSYVLVLSHEGVFLRKEDRTSFLLADPFTLLRAMYLPKFLWERTVNDPTRITAEHIRVERRELDGYFRARIDIHNERGSTRGSSETLFDILEVRSELDSVMPSIGRLLVAVKGAELTAYVEYVRFPDLRVVHLKGEWITFGSANQMLAEHFGQVMADAARIEIASSN